VNDLSEDQIKDIIEQGNIILNFIETGEEI